ncbi:MAG: hypothetical protein K2P58_06475 [Hyphomonadaceae bacterium]|nr:hypothetical protein [Hyphomonadaceae bacterium]
MAAADRLLINDTVGAALRYVRENLRFVATASAIGAVLITVLTVGVLSVPALAFPLNLAMGLAQAFVYAALTAAALFGPAAVGARLAGDGVRVWAAMAVIAFFLFIVIFVISIPVFGVLLAGPMAPYMSELEQAGADQEAVMAVMTRFAESNPALLLGLILGYGTLVLLITSRLYLAAPASVDARRILTFETWSWTKGAMLKIAGARLLLLLPANVFAGAVGYLFGMAIGVNAMAPATTQAGEPLFLLYVFVAAFLNLALFSSLEAGLSAAMYRSLKPLVQQPAA